MVLNLFRLYDFLPSDNWLHDYLPLTTSPLIIWKTNLTIIPLAAHRLTMAAHPTNILGSYPLSDYLLAPTKMSINWPLSVEIVYIHYVVFVSVLCSKVS